MGILDSILQMSLAGSILFLLICIFNPLTKKTFSATWNYYMLVITLFVFLMPLGGFIKFPQVINYKEYIPTQNTSKILQINKQNLLQEDIKSKSDEITKDSENNFENVNKNQVNLGENKTLIKIFNKDILPYVWLLGVIMFLFKEAYFYRSFYKKLKNISYIVEDEARINVLNKVKAKLNINRRIILKECVAIKSPMITGILTPVITIPKMNHNLNKLEIILNHELIHYKRKDLWIKVIALLANVINWFNPITYIIRSKINIICELSLDEQLIKKMDKPERKYYGETILELIEYSQNKSLSLGASVCKSRRELETRLKKIVFFKKSPKFIVCISLIATMIFASTSVFAANSAFRADNNSLKANKSTQFAVFVSSDGLYMSELKEDNPVLLDKSEKIKLPLVSRDGLNVAYTKEDNLYICNIKTHEINEVSKNVEAYDWNSFGNLVYSSENAGIKIYDTNAKNSINLIDNEYNYYNINCDSKNKIYANKELITTKDTTKTIKLMGIVSYDLDTKEEKLILEGKEGTNKEIGEEYTISELFDSLGSTPNVSKISSDDRYMYIWNRPKSGSLSADATEFAVYDLVNNKFIENNDMVALSYKDNFSQNPVDSKLVVVNNGEGREMSSNKALGIYNVENNTFTNLLPEGEVSMMPDYSQDGKNIVYSSTVDLKDQKLKNVKDWFNQPHYIYKVDVDTKEVVQITNSNACDFMPKYLLNNEILFVRQEGDSYSLWKTKDGVETKLADSLNFNSKAYTDTWYYGHYKTEKVIDVYIG